MDNRINHNLQSQYSSQLTSSKQTRLPSPNMQKQYVKYLSPTTLDYSSNFNSSNNNTSYGRSPLNNTQIKQQEMFPSQNYTINTSNDNKNNYQSTVRIHKNNDRVSPSHVLKQFEREQKDLAQLSLETINKELDLNMNEMIFLLNRRKHLILVKQTKLRKVFEDEVQSLKQLKLAELFESVAACQGIFQNIANSADSFHRMKQVIHSVIRELGSNPKERQHLETNRAADFWDTNKTLENEVDQMLQRLKYFDADLESSNYQIQEVCRNLNQMEEQIKYVLLAKDNDHIKKAEPVFNKKQDLHEQLNQLNIQRNRIKDEKIGLTKRILDFLTDLKQLRSERLKDLSEVFGIDDPQADSGQKIKYYYNLVENLEGLALIKDTLQEAEMQEESIQYTIESLFKENEALFQELIKKQSEEAKAYADLSENFQIRINSLRVIQIFENSTNIQGQYDIQNILKRLKDNLVFLKPLVDEDKALQQGLKKTFETLNTFSNILLAIETEKERRKELVIKLEHCIHLKGDGDYKTEEIRNIVMEITKLIQKKKNLEEDLDHILSDADLAEYKKLELQIKSIDQDTEGLNYKRLRLVSEVDLIQQQVVERINQIRNDYDDILKEMISNDVMNNYDFKSANDIKAVKNLLKKTFKRLGVTFEETKLL